MRIEKNILLSLAIIGIILTGMVLYVLSLPETRYVEGNYALNTIYQYFEKAYKVRWVDNAPNEELSDKAFVKNIPWIAYNVSYCASTCLQMIAYKYGIHENVAFFNFIMGFTYGAFLYHGGPNSYWFVPGGDPVTGFINASKVLGFKYNFLVTNDKEVFVHLCKHLIYKDMPVILPVNASRLYAGNYFAPHFELLVGYDSSSFYIYEPVMSESIFKYNYTGIKISIDAIVRANEDYSKGFMFPWKYGLIYFVKEGKPSMNLVDVLISNGELNIGFNISYGRYNILTGSKAIKGLIDIIRGGNILTEELSWSFLYANISRYDNAMFLKNAFSDNPTVIKASQKLLKASNLYGVALRILMNGLNKEKIDKLAEILNKISILEEEAGKLMIKTGKELTSYP